MSGLDVCSTVNFQGLTSYESCLLGTWERLDIMY